MNIYRTALGYHPASSSAGLAEPPVYEPAADIERIVGAVRRQYWLALLGAAAGLLFAALLLMVLNPSYKSSIKILLDQDRNKLLSEISGEVAPGSAEEYIATQIAVLSSDIVARRVIDALNLTYDPDQRRLLMMELPSAGVRQPRVREISSEALTSKDIDPATIYALQKSVSIYQVDKSLVVEITANDPDPVIAQKMAAAFGDAYLTDQLSARFEATKRAGSWLEERLTNLREQSVEASSAVEKFRAENDLVAADGRLLSDQQLGTLNEQLAAAKLGATRASAKVDVFEDAIAKNDVEAIVGIVGATAEIPDSAPIKSMRGDYIQVAQRLRDVSARWGEDNAQAKILTEEVARQAGLVMAEAKRILESYRNDLRTADREVQTTTAALRSAAGRLNTDSATLVSLRSLEQRAAASNSLYQDYLARYQQTVQEQTLSLTTGRLISKAELSGAPTFPNVKVITAIMLVLGAAAGIGIGVTREMLDRTFRSREDVGRIGLDFLGYVADQRPELPPVTWSSRFISALPGAAWVSKRFRKPSTDTGSEPISVPKMISRIAQDIGRNKSTLATVRTGIEIRRRGSSSIVGLISTESNPARSAFAIALAMRDATDGKRVLLIDADHTTSGVSQTIEPVRATKSQELVRTSVFHNLTPVQLAPNLWFISLTANGRVASITPENIKKWGMEFDVVVADLPPVGPISEARMLAPAVDVFVSVVRWGKTQRKQLPMVIHSSPSIESKLVGVVIADVAMERQHLFDAEVSKPRQGRDQKRR